MIRRVIILAAALAAFQAGALTATKEYVDRRDNEISTNRYTKAETDARIVELAPLPGNYETVSNRAMTALQQHQDISGKADATNVYTKAQTDARIVELAPVPGNYATVSNRAMTALQQHQDISGKADKADTYTKAQTDARIVELAHQGMTTNDVCNIVTNVVEAWSFGGEYEFQAVGVPWYQDGAWRCWYNDGTETGVVAGVVTEYGTDGAKVIEFNDGGHVNFTALRDVRNALGLARLVDLPPLTNGLATKVYVDEAIAEAGGGGEWVETNVTATLRFVTGYEHVTVPSGGTLTADTNDWPNGAALMVDLVPGGTYTVSGITMLGYQTWPTNRAEMVVFRSGTNMFANVILTY